MFRQSFWTRTHRSRIRRVPRLDVLESRQLLAGLLNEILVPHAPAEIAAGADGNLWFTEPQVGRIARMTPTGTLTEFLLHLKAPGARPGELIAAPDGNLWFSESVTTNRIGRITPQGQVTEFDLPTAPTTTPDLTIGPDGAVWFTGYTDRLGRIAATGEISEVRLDFGSVDTQPIEGGRITTGADANLWVTLDSSNLIRVTPQGGASRFKLYRERPLDWYGFSNPRDLTTGPDGNVWVGGYQRWWKYGASGAVARLTPDGQPQSYTVTPNPWWYSDNHSLPGAMAPGPDGNVWFTLPDSGEIGSITPDGTVQAYHLPGAHARPVDLVTGPDGNVWYTDGARSRIGRFSAAETVPFVAAIERPQFHDPARELIVYLSTAVDPDSLTRLSNYRLLGPGGRVIPITSIAANYSPSDFWSFATNVITLTPGVRLNPRYRLTLIVQGSRPDGIHTERGSYLNGGTEQRIVIARAQAVAPRPSALVARGAGRNPRIAAARIVG